MTAASNWSGPGSELLTASVHFRSPAYLGDILWVRGWVGSYTAVPESPTVELRLVRVNRTVDNKAVIDEGVFAWQQAKYPVVTAPGLLPAAAPPPQHH